VRTLALLSILSAFAAMPAVAESWDIQFAPPYVERGVDVIDLDWQEPDLIAAAKARGQRVLCYVSVGTAENWRPDFGAFPADMMGAEWQDWPGEFFLDIRRVDVLLPIMAARFQACKAAGADAVDPDNQDQQWAGAFPVTEAETVAYMVALAGLAQQMGLEIGQKNNPDTVDDLVGTLDFIVTEGCFADGWCADVLPYARAGKPIYAIEYTDTAVDFVAACDWGRDRGVSFILKDRNLNGQTWQSCG
jgi:hypothetical protein